MDGDDKDKLRSYLAAQSAKVGVADLRARLDEAAAEFFAAVEDLEEARAHRRPTVGEWSVAEVVDHVDLTLAEVTGIIRTLAAGRRPPGPMTVGLTPRSGAQPLATLVGRLRADHEKLSDLLGGLGGEPHLDLRVADHDFGEINWKGYVLILRLHYKDHLGQIQKTLAAV